MTNYAQNMRQWIVLDTETTGFSWQRGHRIIEIGAIEMINGSLSGRSFHTYLQPDSHIHPGATRVHGMTLQFLTDKPRFAEIADQLCDFIRGSQLIIHNATFDVGFINYELSKVSPTPLTVEQMCSVIDTLAMARNMFPGQKNGLNDLCSRYQIDTSHRTQHGVLIDAHLLAQVYLQMTSIPLITLE